jgi:hypothetical protein
MPAFKKGDIVVRQATGGLMKLISHNPTTKTVVIQYLSGGHPERRSVSEHTIRLATDEEIVTGHWEGDSKVKE